MKQIKSCIECGKKYTKQQYTSQKVWEQRKFCSLSCFGKQASNTHLQEYRLQKGTTLGQSTQFKKGQNVSEANAKWKGDNASYAAIHMWVNNHYGHPKECDDCHTKEDRMYHWANISKEYKREREDWLRLCVPCHKRHDVEALGGKIRSKVQKAQPTKLCAECQSVFPKNPHLSRAQWKKTIYCGRSCSAAVTARKNAGTKQSVETRALKSQKLKERWATNTQWRDHVTTRMMGNQYAKKKPV